MRPKRMINPSLLSPAAVTFVSMILGGGLATVVGAPVQWTRKTDMPTPRHLFASGVMNGKIYAMGGNSGGKFLGVVEEYDPVSNTWTKKAEMPTPRYFLAACTVNAKIYAIGGSGARSVVEEYDPATDAWATKEDLPTGREALSTGVVNAKIYIFGGYQVEFSPLSTVEVYDPATGSVERVADLPTPRLFFGTIAVNEKILALGGATLPPIKSRATVEQFDPGLIGFEDEAGVVEPKGKPVLRGQIRARDGFELILTGEVGRTYRLQACTILASGSWTDLTSLTLTEATTTFLNTAAKSFPQRFYRVVSP